MPSIESKYTDDQATTWYSEKAELLARLEKAEAEIERLRSIIKSVEFMLCDEINFYCAWCRSYEPNGHTKDCIAFGENNNG